MTDPLPPSEAPPLRRTPLHAVHLALGARMVPFGGWEMPVQYSGVVEEHTAVRERAGLFDVSHMGEIELEGPGALATIQRVTSNDASRLAPGRAQYSALLSRSGTFVDDLLVYRRGESRWLLVVNAGNQEKDLAWIREHALPESGLRFASDDWALLAVQGPRALEILEPLAPLGLSALRYYGFAEGDVAGAPALVSRTGYTGEDGFEIYLRPERAAGVWEAVLRAGAGAGIVPCGLGARDTLRLEAKMALYGNDIDETTTPYEADLGWIVKPGKGDFLGADVLRRQAEDGTERLLVGFEMAERGIARHGHPVLVDGRPAGAVTSGTFAPFLRRAIGLAYLSRAVAGPGFEFQVVVRDRPLLARVVETPFYRRPAARGSA